MLPTGPSTQAELSETAEPPSTTVSSSLALQVSIGKSRTLGAPPGVRVASSDSNLATPAMSAPTLPTPAGMSDQSIQTIKSITNELLSLSFFQCLQSLFLNIPFEGQHAGF